MAKPRIKCWGWVSIAGLPPKKRWVCYTNEWDAYVAFSPAEAYAGWSKVVRHG